MKHLVLIVLFVVTTACSPKKEKDPQPAPTEIGDTIISDPVPTSRNSLNYIGLYKGNFPVRNSAGIDVMLELSEEFNYLYSLTQNGKKSEHKGTFKWDELGHGIVLSDKKIFPNEFTVRDNQLIPKTDTDGNEINGKQLVGYELTKLSEAAAIKTDEAPEDKLPPKLTGIHWKLTEINGRVLKIPTDKDYFIQLNADGSFGAFAGCNRMGGKYELKDSKVRLFNVIATMMACPDMKTEDEVKRALETTDNFVANEKILQFRKGGLNLLKFEAAPMPKM